MSHHDGLSEFNPPEPADLQQLLPGYAFEALIAKGGMGAVYKARQISLDRDVAVKILPRELGADPEFRSGFETEARAMARLNHANLIGVYDSGDIDGMPFIVMEYIPGKSLYHSAYAKQVHPDEVVRLTLGILAGLGHAHEHGIIHRDIKPANILLTPKAEPKIGDFGLAVPMDAEGPGLVMGTPGYTAPEVIKNPHAADRRSDIFAVGVIFYELLTGERPAENSPPPSTLCQCQPALDAVYQRATHPNPAFRYPDCAAMAAALEAAIRPAAAGRPAGRPLRRSAAPAAPLMVQKAPARPRPAPAAAPPAAAPPAADATAPPAPAPEAGAAPPQQPLPEIEVGSSWPLVRNLLIIAGLIAAIAIAWKLYQEKRGRIDEENRRRQAEAIQREAETKALQEANRKAAAERRARELAEAAKPKPPPEPEPEPETPFQALQRLGPKLAGGARDEMPPGTARRGEFDFFLVAEPMRWHQAAWFAEQHGGHLAVPATDEDLTWFAERLKDNSAWIGAGRDEAGNWVTIDGARWQLAAKPAGRGAFAALSDLGLVRGTEAASELPFFIQWHRDGSNPATLDRMLQRIRETISKPDPAFPPGTVRQGARHFLLVLRPATFADARNTAERAGGHLIVPSDLTEAIWLEGYAAAQHAPEGIWLGGSLADGKWSWTTGEPWSVDRWAEGQPGQPGDGTAVLTDAKGEWTAAKPDHLAAGFVIEWSTDHQTPVAEATRVNSTSGGTAELKARATELVTEAITERDKALAANARTFVWDLDVWFRGLSKPDQATWGVHVQKLKLKVDGSRVPEQITAEDGIQLAPRMADIATYAAKKQQEIITTCVEKLARIRDSYVSRLTSQFTEAERAGQRTLARELKQAIEQARVDPDDLPDVLGVKN